MTRRAPAPTRYTLSNGLTVLARRDRAAPAVAIVTYVRAGYFDETDDVVGIAHVLEHMYFKGTPTRGVGEIARATKATGGYLNAHTIYDHTSYYTVVPAAGFNEALAIQADAYANSSIDSGELAKEIEVIVQEVRRKEDAPAAVATEELYARLYDHHRMRRWRMGRPDALRGFTRDRVVGFYRNFYQPTNTIVSVVGDLDPDAVHAAVDARYGMLPNRDVVRMPGPREVGRAGSRYHEWSGDIVETQILLGWRTAPTLDPDTPLLDLAAMVLGTGRGSRFYRGVRERRLVSSAAAYDYTPTELGVFVVHAESPPDRAAEAARTIWAEMQRLHDVGVDAQDLLRVQRLLEARDVRRSESMESQASYYAEWEALGDASLGERYLDRALAATADEVTDAVRRHLDPDEMTAVVYRPARSPALASSTEELVAGSRAVEVVPPIDLGRATAPRQASPSAARFDRETAGVRVYRTPSGIPILVQRRRDAQLMHMGVFALGGARDEGPARAGLTSLMVRGTLKGAAGRTSPQFANAIEVLGGSIGGSVGSDSFGWVTSVPLQYATDAVRLLADVIEDPTLDEATIETERALALVELTNLRDDMYRFPVRLATRAAYGDHPYGLNTLGSEEALPSITTADVRAWHARRVRRASLVIGVVGDREADAMAADVARELAGLTFHDEEPVEAPVWPGTSVSRTEARDKAQTALALAFPGPARGDPDRYVVQLIAGVASGLGGRFFDELRDRRSLAYTVHAFAIERRTAGMFMGYIATSPEKEETAREGLLREFEKLAEHGVTSEEVERAQAYAVGTRAISRQSGATLLGEMLDAWLVGRGLDELDTYDARIRAVTPDDVQRVAARYFDRSRVVEGLVRGRAP